MTDLSRLDRVDLPAIAALCRRGIVAAPTIDELEGALCAPLQPAVVRGDPDVGIVATVTADEGAHIRILVVDPEHRGRGHGHQLIRAAEADARAAGHTTITAGADSPYFLWAGVPTTETALCCLFERHHYTRAEANYDMTIDLTTLPPDPDGYVVADEHDTDEVDAFMTSEWPNWKAEVMRGLEKGNLVLSRDAAGISGFCAFDVNRRGFFGPVAVRPNLIGKGTGDAVLVGALHELRRRGRTSIEVVWISPMVPYARLGGRVSTVYFVYRRGLA